MIRDMQAIFEDVGRIAGGSFGKEPEALTDIEKLSLYFMAGGEMEYSTSGMRAAHPFGVQKINGQLVVCIKR